MISDTLTYASNIGSTPTDLLKIATALETELPTIDCSQLTCWIPDPWKSYYCESKNLIQQCKLAKYQVDNYKTKVAANISNPLVGERLKITNVNINCFEQLKNSVNVVRNLVGTTLFVTIVILIML
jgi:hypothetical protein